MDTILNFNDYCKNTTFSLEEEIARLINDNPYTTNIEAINSIIYNNKADSLIPLIEDLMNFIEYLKETDADSASVNEEIVTEVCESICNKYKANLEIVLGGSRVAFIFEHFVIKCDRSYYTEQSDEELNEYFCTMLNALFYETCKIHALLPLVSTIVIDDIVFEIFPRAEMLDNINSISKQEHTDWVQLQSDLRFNILGEGIDQEYNDLTESNLGYYNNKLYIIDAGSIKEFNEEALQEL